MLSLGPDSKRLTEQHSRVRPIYPTLHAVFVFSALKAWKSGDSAPVIPPKMAEERKQK